MFELPWRPFLGHQAWSWSTLRGNVFYYVYKRFFIFVTFLRFVTFFYFYLNVFLHMGDRGMIPSLSSARFSLPFPASSLSFSVAKRPLKSSYEFYSFLVKIASDCNSLVITAVFLRAKFVVCRWGDASSLSPFLHPPLSTLLPVYHCLTEDLPSGCQSICFFQFVCFFFSVGFCM